MVIAQGDIWWADLQQPVGSAPGYRRPVLVLQSDWFNRSQFATVLCAPMTGSIKRANIPGNALLRASDTGLDNDSVVSVAQLVTVDRSRFMEWTGRIGSRQLAQVLAGIDVVLGR